MASYSDSASSFLHDLKLRISLKKISDEEESEYKKNKMHEIMSYVCALHNSGGGRLTLDFEDSASRNDVDNCFRMIEQHLRKMSSVGIVSKMHVDKESLHDIKMIITATNCPVTIDYHLYLPGECEVVLLPPHEPIETVNEVLQGRISPTKSTLHGTHCKVFIQGKDVGFGESKSVQLKFVKSEASKCVTVEKRITGKSNKFPCYISAYANHSGGHIYFGVRRDGIVEGEEIKEEVKKVIVREVRKSVRNMVWPAHIKEPEKGLQWDVFFQPVKNTEGQTIESLYVIVIFIAKCPGGVFTERPDSYHVVNGAVARMSFSQWISRFPDCTGFLSSQDPQPDSKSRAISTSLVNHHILMYNLIQCRNNKNTCKVQLKELIDQAKAQHPEIASSFTELIQLYQEISVLCKKRNFFEAENSISRLESFLTETNLPLKESKVFEVMLLYQKSCLQCMIRNFEKSYELCSLGLEKMESVEPQIITVQFYLHAASLKTILCTEGRDSALGGSKLRSFRSDALENLEQARKHIRHLEADLEIANVYLKDLKQKAHIYTACVHIGCTVNGEVVDLKHVSRNDIEEARKELSAVRNTVTMQTLSHFREIQCRLIECDLNHRCACISGCPDRERHNMLEEARKLAEGAKTLAEQYQFTQMVSYAKKRLAVLKEKL